jgi:hypothetical protein
MMGPCRGKPILSFVPMGLSRGSAECVALAYAPRGMPALWDAWLRIRGRTAVCALRHNRTDFRSGPAITLPCCTAIVEAVLNEKKNLDYRGRG